MNSTGCTSKWLRSLALNLNKLTRINWVAFSTGFIGVLAVLGSIQLGLGKFQNPGPGLFTFIAGALLAILSFVLLVREVIPLENLKVLVLKERIAITATFFSLILIFEYIGFRLSIFFLFLALLRSFGFRRWPVIVGIAVLTALVSDLLFSTLLRMVLPRGPWGI